MEGIAKRAVYAGSFDPMTLGHLDLIKRGSRLFDELVVGVGQNHRKKYLFGVDERIKMIEHEVTRLGLTNVRVQAFRSLLIQFAQETGAQVILRGLRAATDFEYEFQMGLVNMDMSREIETVFLLSGPENIFISSSAVKEIAYFGGDVSRYVSDAIAKQLQNKFHSDE